MENPMFLSLPRDSSLPPYTKRPSTSEPADPSIYPYRCAIHLQEMRGGAQELGELRGAAPSAAPTDGPVLPARTTPPGPARPQQGRAPPCQRAGGAAPARPPEPIRPPREARRAAMPCPAREEAGGAAPLSFLPCGGQLCPCAARRGAASHPARGAAGKNPRPALPPGSSSGAPLEAAALRKESDGERRAPSQPGGSGAPRDAEPRLPCGCCPAATYLPLGTCWPPCLCSAPSSRCRAGLGEEGAAPAAPPPRSRPHPAPALPARAQDTAPRLEGPPLPEPPGGEGVKNRPCRLPPSARTPTPGRARGSAAACRPFRRKPHLRPHPRGVGEPLPSPLAAL